MSESRALRETKNGSDYVLKSDHTSVWIAVDNIAVYLRRAPDGTVVMADLLPRGGNVDEPLVVAGAFFEDAEEAPRDIESSAPTMARENVLKEEGENDYILPEGNRDCWIIIDEIAVNIIRTDEGVVVDFHPAHNRTGEYCLAGTYAFFGEAKAALEVA